MSVTVALWVTPPLVPVMVRVNVPVEVEVVVAAVSVELPEVETEVGLKVPVAPVGRPLKLRFTVPVKPFTAAMVAV
jgi:hypothetical protein